MPDETGTAAAESAPGTAEPPPIATLLPLLQLVLAGSSLSFRFGLRILLTMVYPLHIVWSITHALLSPITVAVKIALDFMLLTPFSIISMVAIALYPVYVFCAVACIMGAAIGMIGHYISTAILGAIARSQYFIPPPSPPPAPPSSGPQVTLRKRKRRSVRLQ